jgi:hypothetical protein
MDFPAISCSAEISCAPAHNMTDQLHTAEYWRRAPREEVERFADGRVLSDHYIIGLAKAELIERDHKYAEEREADRRAWEEAQEQSRRQFEKDRFENEGRRLVQQREHEKALAEFQATAAREAGETQAQATRDSAARQSRAAWVNAGGACAAALAAVASAVAAFLLLWVTTHPAVH